MHVLMGVRCVVVYTRVPAGSTSDFATFPSGTPAQSADKGEGFPVGVRARIQAGVGVPALAGGAVPPAKAGTPTPARHYSRTPPSLAVRADGALSCNL